jgi:homoserine O-acetyltransferase
MSDYIHDRKALGESVGLVELQSVTFPSLTLESGRVLEQVTIAYEMYGALNADRSNAVLILHALSGDSHAAGYYPGDDKPGWWETMIGPGKGFDTESLCLICSNVIAGCKGRRGPSSIDPATGKE